MHGVDAAGACHALVDDVADIVDIVDVVARPTIHRVGAGAAIHRIVARTGVDDVLDRRPDDRLGVAAADDGDAVAGAVEAEEGDAGQVERGRGVHENRQRRVLWRRIFVGLDTREVRGKLRRVDLEIALPGVELQRQDFEVHERIRAQVDGCSIEGTDDE